MGNDRHREYLARKRSRAHRAALAGFRCAGGHILLMTESGEEVLELLSLSVSEVQWRLRGWRYVYDYGKIYTTQRDPGSTPRLDLSYRALRRLSVGLMQSLREGYGIRHGRPGIFNRVHGEKVRFGPIRKGYLALKYQVEGGTFIFDDRDDRVAYRQESNYQAYLPDSICHTVQQLLPLVWKAIAERNENTPSLKSKPSEPLPLFEDSELPSTSIPSKRAKRSQKVRVADASEAEPSLFNIQEQSRNSSNRLHFPARRH